MTINILTIALIIQKGKRKMLNKMNLSKKILILIGIPIIIAFCVTAVVTLNSVNKSVSELNVNELTAKSLSTSHEIEVLFTKYIEVTKQMAANPLIEDLFLRTNPGTVITSVDGFPQIKKNLDNIKATDPDNIVVSWIGDIDSSQFTQSDGYTSGADYVITERGWYKDLIKKQEAFISEPYEDTATKMIIISVVAPVYKAGTKELIGATCIDVSIDSIKAMLKEMKIGKTGFYIMTTGTGQVFYHPNEEYYNLSVADTKMSDNIKDTLLNKTEGEITYTVDGDTIHGYSTPIGNTGWMIVSGMPDEEFGNTFNAVRATVMVIFGSVLLIIIALLIIMSNRITKPLKKAVYMIEEMGKGHFKQRLDIKSGDEIGQIAVIMNQFADKLQTELITTLNMISDGNVNIEIELTDSEDEITPALKKTIDTLKNLDYETESLIQAITKGKLDTRGDAEQYSGTWRELVLSINGLIEVFVAPFSSTSEYMNRISRGDIPSIITEEYNGDFNEIKDSINGLINVMNGLLGETDKLISATREGRLSTRGNADEFSGDWGTLLSGVNEIMNVFTTSIGLTAQYVDRISKGDIPEKITDTYYGDFNEIKNNINSCIDAMNGLLEETNKLIYAAQQGQLDIRGNAEAFTGEWGNMVGGMNDLVDAFVKPINLTSTYVDRISKGDIPDKITDTYLGDFNTTKNNLNNCINIINGLLSETNKLIGAAQEGQLDIRANTEGFTGSWDELIVGMNKLVEAVVEPIKEVTDVMNNISEGNLSVSVKGEYKGEFGVLSKAVNSTASDLNSVVSEISEVIGQISEGNLAISHVTEFKGDFISISNSLNTILESLNSVLGDINMASDQVSVGSKQVSDGSQSMSQGATEQASAIQQLTASVEEVATKTKQNASNAGEANELTFAVKDNAQLGNQHMEEMLEAMEEINESSNNISKIIKVIDDIAFQTNILALNAAVEAARAGQHGKGFAVVAEEVRNLAARSANAAKETTELISGSIKKSSRGTDIANNTAQALNEIVGGIAKTADIIAEIARSSNEQATGIAQISTGLNQVSQVVQNNAATAEESAASSEELSGQAEMLKAMVTRFKLREGSSLKAPSTRLLGSTASTDKRYTSGPKIILTENENDKY